MRNYFKVLMGDLLDVVETQWDFFKRNSLEITAGICWVSMTLAFGVNFYRLDVPAGGSMLIGGFMAGFVMLVIYGVVRLAEAIYYYHKDVQERAKK
jgi:hypothetical protein